MRHVTCHVLKALALTEFCGRQCEILNIVPLDWYDNATEVRLPLLSEDLPVMIEVGRRERHVQFEFSGVGGRPLSNPPDLVGVVCRVRAKGNVRQGHGAL